MSTTTLQKSIFLAASRDTVWEYLTQSDKLEKWFFATGADLKDGDAYGMYQMKDGEKSPTCSGNVTKMSAPSELAYTFTIGPMNGVATTVTWTLEEALGGTKLSLHHAGVEKVGDSAMGLIMALDGGWDKHLSALRTAMAD